MKIGGRLLALFAAASIIAPPVITVVEALLSRHEPEAHEEQPHVEPDNIVVDIPPSDIVLTPEPIVMRIVLPTPKLTLS